MKVTSTQLLHFDEDTLDILQLVPLKEEFLKYLDFQKEVITLSLYQPSKEAPSSNLKCAVDESPTKRTLNLSLKDTDGGEEVEKKAKPISKVVTMDSFHDHHHQKLSHKKTNEFSLLDKDEHDIEVSNDLSFSLKDNDVFESREEQTLNFLNEIPIFVSNSLQPLKSKKYESFHPLSSFKDSEKLRPDQDEDYKDHQKFNAYTQDPKLTESFELSCLKEYLTEK